MSIKQFSILEKVAAIRAILTVAKTVAEKRLDAPVNHIIDAIELAMLNKLTKLRSKPFASLDAKEVVTLHVLETARTVLGDVLAILGDEETTRVLNDDEKMALEELKAQAKAKRELSSAKTKAADKKAAKKATPAKDKTTADMFATA